MQGPRLTIKWMMIAVAIVAVLLFLFRSVEGAMIALALGAVLLPFGWWALIKGHRRPAGWGLAIAAVVGNASVAILDVYMLSILGISLMVLACSLTIPAMLGCGSVWAGGRAPRGEIACWAVILGLALSPLAMMITHWPLRLAFLISRPAMDRLAGRVAAGKAPKGPVWAGVYRVVGTDLDARTGNVGLIIDPDSSGRSGFVLVNSAMFLGPFFNLNFNEHMVGRWRYQQED
jgi:hypothetical protein